MSRRALQPAGSVCRCRGSIAPIGYLFLSILMAMLPSLLLQECSSGSDGIMGAQRCGNHLCDFRSCTR